MIKYYALDSFITLVLQWLREMVRKLLNWSKDGGSYFKFSNIPL